MNTAPRIRAVIFDLGGVILRTDDPEPRRLLAKQWGHSFADLDAIVFNNPVAQAAERGQAVPGQVWTEIGRILNIPDAEIAVFRRAFFAGDKVDRELVQLINQMRGPYRTGLLSNNWFKDLGRFMREDLHIPDIFDSIISSAQVQTTKPGDQIYLLTLQSLDVLPEEAVFVDDNLTNIEAAAQLGIHTIHFQNFSQTRQELLSYLQIPGVNQ